MQWQTYVKRHPIPILAAAALVGLAIGRRVARGVESREHQGSGHAWTSSAAGMDTVARLPSHQDAGAPRLDAMTATWHRLGSRVEGMVNRIIDDVADAAERMVVPALVGGVEAFLAAGRPRPVSGSSYYSSGPGAEGRSA